MEGGVCVKAVSFSTVANLQRAMWSQTGISRRGPSHRNLFAIALGALLGEQMEVCVRREQNRPWWKVGLPRWTEKLLLKWNGHHCQAEIKTYSAFYGKCGHRMQLWKRKLLPNSDLLVLISNHLLSSFCLGWQVEWIWWALIQMYQVYTLLLWFNKNLKTSGKIGVIIPRVVPNVYSSSSKSLRKPFPGRLHLGYCSPSRLLEVHAHDPPRPVQGEESKRLHLSSAHHTTVQEQRSLL